MYQNSRQFNDSLKSRKSWRVEKGKAVYKSGCLNLNDIEMNGYSLYTFLRIKRFEKICIPFRTFWALLLTKWKAWF